MYLFNIKFNIKSLNYKTTGENTNSLNQLLLYQSLEFQQLNSILSHPIIPRYSPASHPQPPIRIRSTSYFSLLFIMDRPRINAVISNNRLLYVRGMTIVNFPLIMSSPLIHLDPWENCYVARWYINPTCCPKEHLMPRRPKIHILFAF